MKDTEDVLINEVIRIVAPIAETDIDKISVDGFLQDSGVDSMKALEIMYAIEKKYTVHMQEQDLMEIEGLGPKSIQEIKRALANFGIVLK